MIVKKSVCGRRQRSTIRVPFEHSHHAQSIVGRNSQTTTHWNDSKMLLSSICIRRFLFYCRPREFERITFNFWLSVSESITGNDKLIPDRLKKNQKEQSMPWNKADASQYTRRNERNGTAAINELTANQRDTATRQNESTAQKELL